MRLIRSCVFLLLVLLGYSCIEPYNPDTEGYEEMLVIEGIIYDDPSLPARVSISRSINLDRTLSYGYESNAIVMVERDDGALYPFSEVAPGVYENLSTPVIPDIGESFRLTIQTEDNKVYESEFEPYIYGSPIDSVIYKPEFQKTSTLGDAAYGLQFYAYSSGADDNPVYLRWLLDATYMYSVPYYTNFFWTGSSVVETGMLDELRVCWKDLNIAGIFIGDSYGLTQNRVADSKLNFVSQYGDALMIKYSLNVTQLSISESSYKFWYDLNKMINETGGLYETQPFKLRSNIECVSDPEIAVTGVFEVAGVTTRRIFAPTPSEFNIFPYRCFLETIGDGGLNWGSLSPDIYITQIENGIYAVGNQKCYDCTLRGGTIIKPPFWE